MNIKHYATQLLAGVALLSTATLMAAESPDLTGDNRLTQDDVMAMIDRELPKWDRSIVQVKSGANPFRQLSVGAITEILQDRPFKKLPPDGGTQVDDGERAVKLDADKGKIRYVSRARAWNYDKHAGKEAVPESYAEEMAVDSLLKLGFPAEEMQRPIVRTQMAGGAKAGAKALQDMNEMYRLVYINRQINDLPVYGNGFRIAVSPEGQIQRLGADWSDFRIPADMRLRVREAVLQQAADEIMSQDPDSEMQITAQLAYAQTSKEGFKPVAVVAVNSKPTPYQLIVDLGSGDTHDKD